MRGSLPRLLSPVLAALIVGAAPAPAQSILVVRGSVVATTGQPIPGASVRLGSLPQVATDTAGRFAISGATVGRHRLTIRSIGYRPAILDLTLPADTAVAPVTMEEISVELGEMVVTGTLAEVRLADSPVKVEVINRKALGRNLANNLMESIRTLPGLREQVDCGVCYTNSISINGMDGPYTAVLFDGVPVLGALATVYALNSLNPALLEQVEVVKGPASTLYGSEAMGGVVNVITRDPRTAPAWSFNSSATTHGQVAADLMVRPIIGGGRMLVAGSASWNDAFIDANGDDFSDLPLTTRISGLVKWSDAGGSARRADLLARYWYEDRFGGVSDWTRSDRGSSEVYGESVITNRWELIGGFRPEIHGARMRIDAALSGHEQDSYYGDLRYHARQRTAFVQAAWAPTPEQGRLRPLVGVTWRRQWYDDDTPATAEAEDRVVPGVFAELEIPIFRRITLLGGGRVDHHAAHGKVVSPRAALRWQPSDWTTVRLNAATGFRVVHLFTEDHAALSGSRRVVIDEALDPERSATVTASVHTLAGIGTVPVTVDFDLFHTRFSNRILPDYDVDPGEIHYRNLDGFAITRGAALGLSVDPGALPFGFRIGATWQRVTRTDGGATSDVEFAPDFKGDFSVYWAPSDRWSLDWTGSVTGPMSLPELDGFTERSPWFTEQNLQVTRAISDGRFLIVGIKNLFDTRQRNPLVAPHDPFGPDFDTYRVWGPVQGRRLMVAVQWNGEP